MSRIQSSKRQRLLTTRRVWILEILVCAALLMAGCRKPVDPAPELMIEHEIAPQPPRVGVATITLKLTDASGHPQTGAIIRLEATMSHAGMRPVFGSAIETDPGRYQTPLEFNMSGDWIVLLHLTLADGRQV
ncbi:MAG TPA: FixH family protein, partial [Candidatus Angelobacter sp.]|nr:FixH family protein [Candidatus Angelobacter sp.]